MKHIISRKDAKAQSKQIPQKGVNGLALAGNPRLQALLQLSVFANLRERSF
jgi:hypothetical protein